MEDLGENVPTMVKFWCYALISVLLLWLLPTCLWLPQIETGRSAEFDEERMTLLFRVDTTSVCPLTPEGGFPGRSDTLKVKIHNTDGVASGSDEVRRYEWRRHFDTESYDQATGGWITLDLSRKRASVNLTWGPSYSWKSTQGDFPLVRPHELCIRPWIYQAETPSFQWNVPRPRYACPPRALGAEH